MKTAMDMDIQYLPGVGPRRAALLRSELDVATVGDIVLFHLGPMDGGRYVMHRILSVDGDAVDIMGDGVPRNHEHVRKGQILAKAVEILRGGTRTVDPYSPCELRKVHFWQGIRPVRRYLLFIYRHLPWNRKWIKEYR